MLQVILRADCTCVVVRSNVGGSQSITTTIQYLLPFDQYCPSYLTAYNNRKLKSDPQSATRKTPSLVIKPHCSIKIRLVSPPLIKAQYFIVNFNELSPHRIPPHPPREIWSSIEGF